MTDSARPVVRPSVLPLSINDKLALYAAYMPFIRHGGLFVPSGRQYQLGDEVFLLLQLMDDPTKHALATRVVWLTPQGAQGDKPEGVGLQFSADEAGKLVRSRIETILAGLLGTHRPTHTL